MEGSAREPLALRYRRGLNLFAPLAVLLGSSVFFGWLVFTMFQSLPASDRQVAWLLSAVLLAAWGVVAAMAVPPLRRFGSAAPAIVVSPEGIRTRDMIAVLPWHHIHRLSVRDVVSSGVYTTATTALEIRPRHPGTGPSGWLSLIDGHAHALRVSLRVIEKPEMIAEALARYAPPELLERSDLAKLPDAERLAGASR